MQKEDVTKTERGIRKLMTIAPCGRTVITRDALLGFNVKGAEEFLGKKLDIHVVDEIK